MDIGVYFPVPSDYPTLKNLGITYAVRPVIATTPDFVSDGHIYRTDAPSYSEVYANDEIDDDLSRLKNAPVGSFVNISNGGWGFRDHLIPPTYHRGLLNGGSDLVAPLRCWWSAHMARRHWGTDWTVILYATPHLRHALDFYRRLGIARAFIWRWDQNADPIKAALR